MTPGQRVRIIFKISAVRRILNGNTYGTVAKTLGIPLPTVKDVMVDYQFKMRKIVERETGKPKYHEHVYKMRKNKDFWLKYLDKLEEELLGNG